MPSGNLHQLARDVLGADARQEGCLNADAASSFALLQLLDGAARGADDRPAFSQPGRGSMKRVLLALVAILLFSIIGSVQADSVGPQVNPFRAYPPSCLADPLSSSPSGPSWSVMMDVVAVDVAAQQFSTETVKFTFWRSPCSDGTSALLGLFQRSAANTGRTDVVPFFPSFEITQGNILYTAS